jgi:uncharacterized alkaline shock family protein YloU
MTTPTTDTKTSSSTASPASVPAPRSTPNSADAGGPGRTRIADTVVSKIAGLAAREVNGVYKLGGGAARAFGAIRERIPGGTTNAGQGVTVEVGETQAAVDLDMAVEYGVPIVDLTKAVRRNVITSLERMTGLEVVEVNINVDDVHLPSDDDADDGQPRESRVQ